MWPQALPTLGIDLKGKIADAAEPGRAIARLTDLGHGQALRELFRAEDGPVPVPLARAVVEILGDWRPQVDAIVAIESLTRPALVGDFAHGLSRYLQRPVVGMFALLDPSIPPGAGAANSAQRVAAVARRSGLRARLPQGARVLLVDDRVVTGWTLTIAARELRAAGAAAVLPLTLAVES
jgi:ATP-dependent DNA helicase RecQ